MRNLAAVAKRAAGQARRSRLSKLVGGGLLVLGLVASLFVSGGGASQLPKTPAIQYSQHPQLTPNQ